MSAASAPFPLPTALPTDQPDRYLGPGRVLEVIGGAVRASLANELEVRADMALAFPYHPQPDDVLLIIGQDEAYYVIGVLKAQGDVALRFLGNVHLHALRGKLHLKGDDGVYVHGDTVELLGAKLKILAGSVVERADRVYRTARELLSQHLGEKRELITGEWHTAAGRANVATEGTVTINGKEIHLG